LNPETNSEYQKNEFNTFYLRLNYRQTIGYTTDREHGKHLKELIMRNND